MTISNKMARLRKAIFLEYKFGDYDTKTLYSSGANEVVAWMERLNPTRLKQLRDWHVEVNLSFAGFEDEICPLDLQSIDRLQKLIKTALEYGSSGIIIDHFRFQGRWEQSGQELRHVLYHGECQYCKGKDKGWELARIAETIRKLIPPNIKLGYYAVPFAYQEFPQFGQDHALLTNIFDYSSPMLYHRMLGKPVEYIHLFTKYLSGLANKPVIPAIAVKDMPDGLPDQINESILRQEYKQAILPPSAGVCWFSWDGAIEKHKTGIIAKIWR